VETQQKRSVGLIMMSHLKMNESEPELVAALMKRGERNHEKGFLPESWPGACQETCHGRLEENEDWLLGLFREAREELTPYLWNILAGQGKSQSDFVLLNEFGNAKSPEWVRTYGVLVDISFFQQVRLNASTGGLKFIDRDTVLTKLEAHHKDVGVLDRDVVAMFPNIIQAVKKAFEVFGKKEAKEPPVREHFDPEVAPQCPRCGQITVRNGACWKCLSCGELVGAY
jgi:hypothetical protein